MPRTERNSYEIGNELEIKARDLVAGRRVPGSGNGKFLKLDISDVARFIYSCKSSETLSTTATRAIAKLWRETVRGTRGLQGHGDGARPGMIFEVEGELLVLTRLADHVELATGEVAPYIAPEKAQERRNRSRRTLLE